MVALKMGSIKIALAFAVGESEHSALSAALAPVAVKCVPPEQYAMPVSAILQGQKPMANGDVKPLAEPMLVFHGFENSELDAALKNLKNCGVKIPLKAVTTPTNMSWDAYTFYDNLSKERKAIKKGYRRH